jgi:formylglycine-generating enzyme required for sulfatase activity
MLIYFDWFCIKVLSSFCFLKSMKLESICSSFFVLILLVVSCVPEANYEIVLDAEAKSRFSNQPTEMLLRVIAVDRLEEYAEKCIDLANHDLVDLEMLQNLESDLAVIRLECPELSELSRMILDCRLRREAILSRVTNQLSSFIKLLPPSERVFNINESITVRGRGRSFLVISTKNAFSAFNKTVFAIIPLAPGREKILASDAFIDDPITVVRVISGLRSKKVVPRSESIDWMSGIRFQANLLKVARQRELQNTRWKEFFGKFAKGSLKPGDRFESPLNNTTIATRWIPSGEYWMGSPTSEPNRFSDEIRHRVTISQGFLMTESECTQGEWASVMTNNPSYFKGEIRPVEQVTWEDAVKFCDRLTKVQLTQGLIPEGFKWRLPSEGEWEYACRSGGAQAFSSDVFISAWVSENANFQTHPIRTKEANAWGLHDVHGNVWEWCLDWYNEYPNQHVTDPISKSVSLGKVFRGGGWFLDSKYGRSAARRWSAPNLKYSFVGFRSVLVYSDPKRLPAN